MLKETLNDLRKGASFGLGIILIFGIIFGVYAFVEPSSGPGSNYVIDWSSPLNSKHNDTNVKVNDTNNKVQAVSGLTANGGMYDNRIPSGTFPLGFTEICFKSGSVYNDSHAGTNQATTGGNCLPGDVGYIIEQAQRTADYWEGAKITCTKNNMRLPEGLEYKYACKNEAGFSLSSMTGNWEWSSNEALPMYNGANYGVGAAVMGGSGCGYATWGWVGYGTGGEDSSAFRCAR